MPRVWIAYDDDNNLVVDTIENPDGTPVDMNASLFRQIQAANTRFYKFQGILMRMYLEAVRHPKTVRRVR
jgi:hypothetical protein